MSTRTTTMSVVQTYLPQQKFSWGASPLKVYERMLARSPNHDLIPVHHNATRVNWMVDLQSIQRIVREEMSELKGTAHSYDHVDRVLKIATSLAEKENADLEMVQVGSLLHDIGRTIGEPHAEKGVEPARRVLTEFNVPRKEMNKILRIVEYHDVKGREKLETLEGKVVWDADKIDLIGLTGASRAFHYAGETNMPFNDAVKWCINRSMHQPYEFFTETAREIADRRYAVMKRFALTLENELSLTDIK